MALLHLANLVTNEKLATQTWIPTRGENQSGATLAIAPSQTLEATQTGMDPHDNAIQVICDSYEE